MSDIGLRIKNSLGEVIVDGLSNMGQHFSSGVATVNGYQYAPFTFSTFPGGDVTTNVDIAWSVSNYASPMWRCYDAGTGYLFNRFWYTMSPAPYWKISMLKIGVGGTGIENEKGKYGIYVGSKENNELISSDNRSLIWKSQGLINASWDTISGAYDNWIWGPFTIDYSTLGFTSPPFVMVTPLGYLDLAYSTFRLRAATVFYNTSTEMKIGDYLTQTTGFNYLAGAQTYEVVFFQLD